MISGLSAQEERRLVAGDPPVAALISVSAPDEAGIVTITGSAGAVYPSAQVAIRNLYTEDVVYVQAGITGSFSAQIYGPGRTPFWVNPTPNVPSEMRDRAGSLPGGPGTIIYGTSAPIASVSGPISPIYIDGHGAEWVDLGYDSDAPFAAFANRDSLYVRYAGPIPDVYDDIRLSFMADGTRYALTFHPVISIATSLTPLDPSGTPRRVLVASEQADVIELRLPLSAIGTTANLLRLESWQFTTAEGDGGPRPINQDVAFRDESDGIVYAQPMSSAEGTFFVGGALSGGAARWWASGRVNQVDLDVGAELIIELDVTMRVPELAPLDGLKMLGQLDLQPIAGADNRIIGGGLNSLNGWSASLTPTGLPIDNLRTDLRLAEALVPPEAIIRRGDDLLFGMQFRISMPRDLPPGLYVPSFVGLARVQDGEIFRWDDNNVFAQPRVNLSRVRTTRLPFVLGYGGVREGRLLWTLFNDIPSDGSRGVVAQEDAENAALSNRVRWNSPTYILPPGEYPVEPYLPFQLPNAYDSTAAPLIPLLLPGGRLSVRLTRPDGTTLDLGSAPFTQSHISTAATDEKRVFGASGPLDMARLTTLDPTFRRVPFDQYGLYIIQMTGAVDDIWEHRYQGGGQYHLLIAEWLDMTPSVLYGTPFAVGDVFTPALSIAPAAPADIQVTLRVYPLDGSGVIERVFTGKANAFGHFNPTDGYRFETMGEYVADYEVRFTDAQGRLWAASARGAGVIGRADGALIARGRRGLEGEINARQAWFDTGQYPVSNPDSNRRPYYPYYSGDVVWSPEGGMSGIVPILQVQDAHGLYRDWLIITRPDERTALGDIRQLARLDELPLLSVLAGPPTAYRPALMPESIVNSAYAYLSAVRPDVTVRQWVQGSDDTGLRVDWDNDDPLNGQLGAGIDGNRVGDYIFLFGGAIIRNAEAGINEAAIYGALAVVDRADATARVLPPHAGQAGGPSGGKLLSALADGSDMFFHPTGIRPAHILVRDEPIIVAGYVAPPSSAKVNVVLISPSGVRHTIDGRANAVGYFHLADSAVVADEVGVWTAQVSLVYDGMTSAGLTEPPLPHGGLIGESFAFYVVADATALLDDNLTDSISAARPGLPTNFTFTYPNTWTQLQAHYTIATASYVLSSGETRAVPGSFSFQYNPSELSRTITNLENTVQGQGASASDVVQLTFFLSARDENGVPIARARTYTLMHDRLIRLDEGP